jgi:hypothetical protein
MMYSYLIAGVSRDRSDEAFALIRDWATRGLEKPSPKASELMGIATAVDALVSRDTTLTNEAKLALLAQLQAKLAGDDPRLESSRQTILSRKISILLDADRKDEALAELETMIAAACRRNPPRSVLAGITGTSTGRPSTMTGRRTWLVAGNAPGPLEYVTRPSVVT